MRTRRRAARRRDCATVGDVLAAIEVEPGCAIESDADAFSRKILGTAN
ncbi:hypothetical protein IMX07_03965 [bacterium]|nr:hypothetical protein [bacterium]